MTDTNGNGAPPINDREFDFVETISREVWAKKPGATIVVYPHYFSGAKVPGFDATAATKPFDPRWTLFFTPHSAHLDLTTNATGAGVIERCRLRRFRQQAFATAQHFQSSRNFMI